MRIDSETIDGIKDLEKFNQEVRQAIPMGMKVHREPVFNMERDFPYKEIVEYSRKFVTAYNEKFKTNYPLAECSYKQFEALCKRIDADQWRAQCSLGTLGGGNHFIEIGKNENGEHWLTVHSGSRNFGLKIATYWQNIAKKDVIERNKHYNKITINKIKATCPKRSWDYEIKAAKSEIKSGQNLEYLEGRHMMGYFMDSIFAHFYAKINRELMLNRILQLLKTEAKEIITSTHNYIDFKDMIIRKGAISSYIKQRILIPFNMEDGILICLGRSNKDWNFSAPHGSGRLGSRRWAKEQFDSEEVRKRMAEKGIFSAVIPTDEVKEAYKDATFIKKAIDPTAYIICHIKPLINFKTK